MVSVVKVITQVKMIEWWFFFNVVPRFPSLLWRRRSSDETGHRILLFLPVSSNASQRHCDGVTNGCDVGRDNHP